MISGMDNLTDYTEANRAAWNQRAPVHASHSLEALIEQFRQPGFSVLHKPNEVERLRALELKGKNVAQLCCNNGRELLSVKNLFGAARCVGFDISDEFIDHARALNSAANQDVEFVRANVLEIPDEFSSQFDLVYVTIGALGWLPDIAAFFRVVSNLLKPGGNVLIYEMHPFLDLFDNEEAALEDPLRVCHSYFKSSPYVEMDTWDYLSGEKYAGKTSYWFHHKLSDIFTGLIRNNIQITAFDEFDFDISNVFGHLEKHEARPPMCYILEGRKSI